MDWNSSPPSLVRSIFDPRSEISPWRMWSKDKRDEEARFIEWYLGSDRKFLQIYTLFGGIIFYSFFLWDDVIDASSSPRTQLIRALTAIFIVIPSAMIAGSKIKADLIETLLTITITITAISLSLIYCLLHHGFDLGAAGIVLILMFGFSLPIRAPKILIFAFISTITFASAQLISMNFSEGMILVNALYISAGAAMGLVSSLFRECGARARFRSNIELANSRERIEDLLQSILPDQIVRRIQNGETRIADSYGDVAIVFADLVGFTELSRKLSPAHLVEILSDLFFAFDEGASLFSLDRIKTIGDAYMAVGGLSRDIEGKDYVAAAAEFSLHMKRIVQHISDEAGFDLRVRIGLHVGPVVAGVIGLKRPAFDCWGDTVNLASRLEHNAAPDDILISESTYWRIRDRFRTRPLEPAELKGIGPTNVYVLEGYNEK